MLVAVGPNAEWSIDGFDKLNSIGFGIYGIRDKWSRKWLHYVVVPSNRYAAAVGVIYLHCVRKYGGAQILSYIVLQFINLIGVPMQTTSDRGSEVRDAFSFQSALR